MDLFSYLKRIGDLRILGRFVSNMESANPTLLKYISLKALNLSRVDREGSYKDLRTIEGVVKDQIFKNMGREWTPSEVTALMCLFSSLKSDLDYKVKSFLESQLLSYSNYNVYDLVQVLSCYDRLGLKIDVCRIVDYFQSNLTTLLVHASAKNVYSFMDLLTKNRTSLSTSTMVKILDHFRASALNFQESTNLLNAVSRQVSTHNYHEIETHLEDLISKIMAQVGDKVDDLEGLVDFLDAQANFLKTLQLTTATPFSCNSSSSIGTASGSTFEGEKMPKYDVIIGRCTIILQRIKTHLKGDVKVKLLHVLLRSINLINFKYDEIIDYVLERYLGNPAKWSLQGNIELLRTVNLFQRYQNFSINEWIKCVDSFPGELKMKYQDAIVSNLVVYNYHNGGLNLMELVHPGRYDKDLGINRESGSVPTYGIKNREIGLILLHTLAESKLLPKLPMESLKKLKEVNLGSDVLIYQKRGNVDLEIGRRMCKGLIESL